MPNDVEEPEVLEPEVLPPEGKAWRARGPGPAQRAQRAFAPILAGAFLDFMDLATMGPVGMAMGAVAGFWIASVYGLPLRTRILMALGSGYYCALPATNYLPLATLLGAIIQLRGAGSRARRR